MLTKKQQKLLSLLLTCEDANVALAKELALGLKIDLVKMLESEGFFELGFSSPDDFWNPEYHFINRRISNLRALKHFRNDGALNFYDNRLEGLHGAEFSPDIYWLCTSANPMGSLFGLENFPNLTNFYCSSNNLQHLNGIEILTQLTELDCSYNQLTNLAGLENLTELSILNASVNELENLDALLELPNLQELDVTENPKLTKKILKAFQKKQPNCNLIAD